MDEYFGSATPKFLREGREAAGELMAKSGILILASHSPELIAKECNRVIRLEHGRVVER